MRSLANSKILKRKTSFLPINGGDVTVFCSVSGKSVDRQWTKALNSKQEISNPFTDETGHFRVSEVVRTKTIETRWNGCEKYLHIIHFPLSLSSKPLFQAEF